LLCIAALAVLMLRYTKRRFLFIAGAGVLGLTALPFLPQSYYDRMATIAQPSGDESASTRVAVWKWTLDYVETKPLGGGFDAYRSNKFTYVLPVKKTEGNTTTIEYTEVEDKARAYHSSVFEMLGEQGWPGLGMWLLLHLVGLWQMERIQRRWKRAEEETTRWIAPLAAALQMGALIYLVGALFQGIAYQPVMLMLVGLQIGLNTYCLRIDSARGLLERSASRRAAVDGQMRGAVAA
ncbi:MAG: putative O-glycosylation ligase, exosortase A system-associated, partial [Erythrobacter sp.]|nr:putative O-glycosylation ligase, exosortase A system-associated [Erythrobacter sp.]